MAGKGRPAVDKTPIQKAADAARDKLAKAKEAMAKNPNDVTRKAAADALAAKNNAEAAERRERWEVGGANRVSKTLAAIEVFASCANPRGYTFNAEEVQQAFAAINAAVAEAEAKFNAALSSPGGAPSPTGVKFSFTKPQA